MNLPLGLFLSTVIVRTLLILIALIVGIRLFGQRGVGELDLIDMVMVLLLGNAVQNALTYGSGDVWVGVASAGTLLFMNKLMGMVFAAKPAIQHVVVGEPVILVADGDMDRRKMRKNGVIEDEVRTAMRLQGLDDLKDVHLAVLEVDGTISIVPKQNPEK